MNNVKRGDIYYADLSPVVGSEQGGLRPVLIIQNDIGNRYSPTVIAAAITSKMDKTKLPTHIDVFAEKPVAASLSELKTVEDAVKTHNIRFCAMHYLRFAPAFYHASRMVREGAIGKPVMITAQKSYKFGSRPDWYSDPKLYTGTVPWVGIHALDWIYSFAQSPFVKVSADSVGSPEMAAVCRFELKNGVFGAVNLDYLRPDTAPTHGDDRIRVAGENGIIEVIGNEITLINKDGASTFTPSTANTPELLTEFLDGKEPITAEEIFHITKAAIVARDSANTGVYATV